MCPTARIQLRLHVCLHLACLPACLPLLACCLLSVGTLQTRQLLTSILPACCSRTAPASHTCAVRTALRSSEELFPTQDSLPPLPLPALADTCERYLDTCRPLLTEEQLAHTKQILDEFCRSGGDGEELQAMLEERAANSKNWMEEWWEQLAYLRTRTTMAIHINWFGVIPDWGLEVDLTNVQTAALLLSSMLQLMATLEAGAWPVEKLRGNPLDMHQFTRLWGMTRVPCEGSDQLVQSADSKHIIILRDGAAVRAEAALPCIPPHPDLRHPALSSAAGTLPEPTSPPHAARTAPSCPYRPKLLAPSSHHA